MKNGLVIADSGPVFSLAVIDKLDILTSIFNEVLIPNAVWLEIISHETKPNFHKLHDFFVGKVRKISGFNDLIFMMDTGESEAVILYKEMKADFLLIDDKKARAIAENLEVTCIGVLGLLAIAKDKGLINELKPLFEKLIQNKRFYAIEVVNFILSSKGESKIIRL
jgi:predicted nucleic acid-binding protein